MVTVHVLELHVQGVRLAITVFCVYPLPTRPSEISSKKRASTFREVVPIPKKREQKCDPRFDERAGNLNEDLFKKSFGFIEEMRQTEKKALLKESKRTHNKERKEKLQQVLQHMVSTADPEACKCSNP